MKRNILIIVVIALLMACNSNKTPENEMKEEKNSLTNLALKPNEVMAGINLTVSEGKRLIAVGIARHPLVKQKMESGMIIITRGSTNTYIAEELTRLDAPRGSFVTGNITPQKGKQLDFGAEKVPEIILVNGKQVEMTYKDALVTLKKDDIVFKGGNLLNYDKKQAAVTVASADGGTVGRLQPYTGEGQAHLIVPIGLEKEVPGDLNDYENILSQDVKKLDFIPRIIVHKNAEIFTEIEALKLLGNIKVIPYASGGIAGREGGKSLAIYGDSIEVDKVLSVISEIQGEAPFIE